MQAATRNYDILCLQMWNNTSQLDEPLRAEMEWIVNNIVRAVTESADIKTALQALFPRVFDFRIKALKWLVEEEHINLADAMKNVVWPQLEALKKDPRLVVLAENLLFALRSNMRVINSLLKSGALTQEVLTDASAQVADLTYTQLVTSIAYSIPSQEYAQLIMDWMGSALFIEMGMMGAVLIHEKQLPIGEVAINDLAALVADAAQTNAAIAMHMQFIPDRTGKGFSGTQYIASDEALEEDKRLADAGLDEFATSL